MEWRIDTLDLGSVELDKSRTVQNYLPGEKVFVPVRAFVLRSALGTILVDSGFRSAAILERIGMRASESSVQNVKAQLSRLGLEISDVDLIVQTHLHIDHAGQTDLFPMTTSVVVDRRELEFSVSGLGGSGYPPEDIKHFIDRLHEPGALRLLDLTHTLGEVLLPGLRCLPAGGHTPGSLMVMVNTKTDLVCICGDIIYNMRMQLSGNTTLVDDPTPSGNHASSRLMEKVAIKRALNSGATLLYPSHDKPGRIVDGRVIEFDLELP